MGAHSSQSQPNKIWRERPKPQGSSWINTFFLYRTKTLILSYTQVSWFTHSLTLYLYGHFISVTIFLVDLLKKLNRGSKTVNYNYSMMTPITNTGTPIYSKEILITLYHCSSASHFKTILEHSNVESKMSHIACILASPCTIYVLYKSAKPAKGKL